MIHEKTTVGRHSTNKLVICDESVSRFHCEIVQIKESFHLLDIGSTTGTYLKIKKKQVLENNMTIEMGSN